MVFRDIFEEANLAKLASMEFKSRRMEMLKELTEKCQSTDNFIWKRRYNGDVYCVSPDDCPCEYRMESGKGEVHRYRCGREICRKTP